MEDLYLVVKSFADVDLERALAVAQVFDSYPDLRPRMVGGDPARTKVEPSMQSLVRAEGLPVDWLTVRRNGRYPDLEVGRLSLLPGRGSWHGSHVDGLEPNELDSSNRVGDFVYHLAGHEIEQHWLAATMSEAGSVEAVAAMFNQLVLALDAAYGYVVAGSQRPDGLRSVIDRELPGVFWLNYFGPAFLTTHPGLGDLVGACPVRNGGVIVQTADSPWHASGNRQDGRDEVRSQFDADAFRFIRPRNFSLPSIEAHLAVSPGRNEMPWLAHLAEKENATRARRHASGRTRLCVAAQSREEPVLAADLREWSTSFDAEDFLAFFAHLKRRLGGELAGPLGTALRSVITNAPLDEEDSVVLLTKEGPIRIGWFIDDFDTVDIYVYGVETVRTACESFLD